jgi:hypothetical protein
MAKSTKFIDLTGMRFGRLVALELIGKSKGQTREYAQWECRCDCGKTTIVLGMYLRAGKTKSCGCFQRDRRSESHTTHGLTDAPVYRVYHHILRRCNKPESSSYPDYGGRGITVCERWTGKGGFENFIADMGIPEKGMSIERIDVNGNYEPNNCKWATREEQANNKRTSRKITWDGKTLNVSSWSRLLGKEPGYLSRRLKRMPFEKAMEPFSNIREGVMAKPRLTKIVLEGLTSIAGFVEAGSSSDILGYEPEDLDAESKETWRNIERACEWIREMQTYKVM